MRQVRVDTHGGEDVARFEGARRAGAPAAGCHVRHVQREQHAFALHVPEATAEVIRKPARGIHWPCNDRVRDTLREFEQETVAEYARVGIPRIKFVPGQFHCGGQASYPGDVLRPGPALLLLRTPEDERPPRRPVLDVQQPDPFRAVELVPGDAQKVDPQRGRPDIDSAGSLNRIGVDDHLRILRLRKPADFSDGLERANLVVRRHHRDHRRFRPNRGFKRGKVDNTGAVDRQIGSPETFAFELFDCVEDGVVLDGRGDDVVAAATVTLSESGPTDGGIVRFGAAASENDLFRSHAKEVGAELARRINGPARFLALEVDG